MSFWAGVAPALTTPDRQPVHGRVVLLWPGWLQRSWRRSLIGAGSGLLAGWLCYQLTVI